jgi:O-antigen ligase
MDAAGRLASWALLLLPGGLTIYLSFNGGGFYPNTQAFAALVLAAALVLRIAFAEEPFAGFSKPLGVAVAGLALYALWTLASAAWSDATARALLEFNRALLYLLALVLFGSLPRTASNFRWMVRGLALGIVVVCVCGLVTRVLPDVWPISEGLARNRLSYPLTYWNAMGLLASVGAILCFHLACSRSEPAAARVLGAGAVPLLVTTLYFTFSRGAIAAGIVGLVAYVGLARPRALLSGLLAAGPGAAIAVVVAYDADLLATGNPTRPAAVDQGQEVALIVALCVVGAAVVRGLLMTLDSSLRLRWGSRRLLAGGAIVAMVVLLVLDAPGYVGDQYERFVEGGGAGKPGDLRSRLTDPANSGRLEHWEVAMDSFADAPLEGQGAGTYQNLWARDRPLAFSVRDAHSLYVEVLGELGVVGIALLLVVFGTIVAGLVNRVRGPDRTVYGAALAALIVWLLHAGLDWDWEMPAVTLWVFALGGAALAARSERPSPIARPGAVARPIAVLACFAVAVVPGLSLVSDERLQESAGAFERGDCAAAIDAADSSIGALAMRPEPYELRAFCRLRGGRIGAGVEDLERAVDRDPQSWTYHYELAIARGVAGSDPRPEALRALRLNPLDVEAQDAARRFNTANRRAWRRQARALLRGASPFYLSER